MSSEKLIQEYYDFIVPLVVEIGKKLTQVDEIEVESKNEQIWDTVTVHDRNIEADLTKKIMTKYPNHKWIGEEESDLQGKIKELTDETTWIIDPIDGTANFVRKFPITAISVGVLVNKVVKIGVIYNPFTDELFTAVKGKGAFLNGEKIKTSGCTDIFKSVFTYELSIARRNSYWHTLYMYRLKHIIKAVTGIRSLGCAVMSLAYVACGKLDGYQSDGLYPWDAAAGSLIVQEAGGYMIETSGDTFDVMKPAFIAAATKELAEEYVKTEKAADEEIANALASKKEFSL